jgi:hypothetical protein
MSRGTREQNSQPIEIVLSFNTVDQLDELVDFGIIQADFSQAAEFSFDLFVSQRVLGRASALLDRRGNFVSVSR